MTLVLKVQTPRGTSVFDDPEILERVSEGFCPYRDHDTTHDPVKLTIVRENIVRCEEAKENMILSWHDV